MDYKKLVEDLRREAVNQQIVIWKVGPWSELEKAANAIETLLAERDAAVKDIAKNCVLCSHFRNPNDSGICFDCWHVHGTSENWEWRGQQTE